MSTQPDPWSWNTPERWEQAAKLARQRLMEIRDDVTTGFLSESDVVDTARWALEEMEHILKGD